MPQSGKIPHAAKRLGPWAMAAEPARLEPVLRSRRGRDGQKPVQKKKEKDHSGSYRLEGQRLLQRGPQRLRLWPWPLSKVGRRKVGVDDGSDGHGRFKSYEGGDGLGAGRDQRQEEE